MALKNVDVWQVLIGQPLIVCAHLLPICSTYAVSVLATKAINWSQIWSRVQIFMVTRNKSWHGSESDFSTKHHEIVEHEAVHTCAGNFWVHQCGNFQQYVCKHITHSIIILSVSDAMKSPHSSSLMNFMKNILCCKRVFDILCSTACAVSTCRKAVGTQHAGRH